MTNRKIEQRDGSSFGQQQLLANSIENFILHEKKLTCSQKCQSIKTLLTLELSQYHTSGSMFSSSKQVALAVTAAD